MEDKESDVTAELKVKRLTITATFLGNHLTLWKILCSVLFSLFLK